MSETSPERREHGRTTPLLHKRLERFVRCHVNSAVKLDVMRTLGHHPNRFHTLAGLEHPVAAPLSAVSPLTRMSRKEIEENLHELVAEGVIDCRRDGAMPHHALTPDVSIRKAVEQLPRLTASERSHLLRHPMRQRVIMDHRHDSETTPNVTEDTLEGGTP